MLSLNEIGLHYGTDKASSGHDYLKTYATYFEQYRHANVALIEAGVGGYEYPDRGGESLRMWRDYFHNGHIIGLDIYDKTGIINDRMQFWRGSQDDKHLLTTIMWQEHVKNADIRIFIDDASHINALTIKTFEIVFTHLLKPGDFYIIEDCHTSYWKENYAGNPKPNAKGTSMKYIQDLLPQLHEDTLLPEHRIEYIAGYLEFVHFYRNLIVLRRKIV